MKLIFSLKFSHFHCFPGSLYQFLPVVFANPVSTWPTLISNSVNIYSVVEEVSTHYSLEISETKTEWLVMKHEDSINNSGEQLTLKGKPLKKVDQFRYLGATITSNGDCTTDITLRTATALSVMNRLSSIFKNRKIASKSKIRLYKSLIQSIASYGCVTWTLIQAEEK